MKLKLHLTFIFIFLIKQVFCSESPFQINQTPKTKHLYALIEPSDSGSSVTLAEADKKATAAENKRSKFFPIFFSPLLIVIIVIAAKRRKKRKEEENKK